jgi:hypothetical protein
MLSPSPAARGRASRRMVIVAAKSGDNEAHDSRTLYLFVCRGFLYRVQTLRLPHLRNNSDSLARTSTTPLRV